MTNPIRLQTTSCGIAAGFFAKTAAPAAAPGTGPFQERAPHAVTGAAPFRQAGSITTSTGAPPGHASQGMSMAQAVTGLGDRLMSGGRRAASAVRGFVGDNFVTDLTRGVIRGARAAPGAARSVIRGARAAPGAARRLAGDVGSLWDAGQRLRENANSASSAMEWMRNNQDMLRRVGTAAGIGLVGTPAMMLMMQARQTAYLRKLYEQMARQRQGGGAQTPPPTPYAYRLRGQ